MKSKSSLIIAVFIFVIFAIAVFFRKLKSVKIHNVRSFNFVYSYGDTASTEKCYKLSVKEGTYTASFKDSNISDNESKSSVVDKVFVDRLEDLLNRYKVTKWDRFDKSDKHVTDGKRFSIEIYDENGSSVSAHGYGKTPRKFSEVKRELEVLFGDLFNSVQSDGL